MSEAEAIDRAHANNLLQAQRARHRLARDIQLLGRVGARLVHTGERTLKVGAMAVIAFGGILLGLLVSVAFQRR